MSEESKKHSNLAVGAIIIVLVLEVTGIIFVWIEVGIAVFLITVSIITFILSVILMSCALGVQKMIRWRRER